MLERLRARLTGRSWWALLYTDGTVVHEWDADAGSPTGHMDWAREAMLGRLRHIRALRLYCPNGRYAEVGSLRDQTGLLFQFKVGLRTASSGGLILAERQVLAHVIGQITGYDGQCRLYAWEPGIEGGQLLGPLEDNVWNIRYQQVGRLSADHLGLVDGEGR